MISSLKAELRKIYTVRSTYLMLLLAVGIGAVLIGFWIFGYKDVDKAAASNKALFDMLLQSISAATLFLSFVTVLLVCHEYRYNTIMYNLTNVNHRSKLFFAKYLTVLAFGLIATAVVMLIAWALFSLGQSLSGVQTLPQQVPMWDLLGRAAATVVGYMSYAFIIAMLLRNLIGSIAVLLVVPSTIENLMTLFLHDNTKYLPFTALGKMTSLGAKDLAQSAWIVLVYVAVGGAISYVLFLKRDAN